VIEICTITVGVQKDEGLLVVWDFVWSWWC